jgi:hypothetical protein
MAMLRFYANSWLIHHHAAKTGASHRAGLVVLEQVVRFINDSHRLYSMHMNHVLCYFRPDNKFPNQVFGGAARHINDRSVCSVDSMAYLHFDKQGRRPDALPAAWSLTAAQPLDLSQLRSSYDADGGGLMMTALELGPGQHDGVAALCETYRQIGFRRRRQLYSLKHEGCLKAVIMLNQADLGLNMSDLTNCMTVFVVDADTLDRETLEAALATLADAFEGDQVPVLLHPHRYAAHRGFACEKQYSLWALKLNDTDRFYDYIAKLLKFARRRQRQAKTIALRRQLPN